MLTSAWVRGVLPIAIGAVAIATLPQVGSGPILPSAQAVAGPLSAPVRPMAAPSGAASAFAIIGHIALPGSPALAPLYTSADDTVYTTARNGQNYVAIINPGTTSGSVDGQLTVTYAYGVATGSDGTLYVASWTDGKVQVFAPGATTGASAIREISGFDRPNGVGLNEDDTLAVTSDGNRFYIVAPGSSSPVANVSNSYGGSETSGIAVDSNGNFAMGTSGSGSTSAIAVASNGLAVGSVLTGMSIPSSLVYGSDDTLYAIGRGSNSVYGVTDGSTAPDHTISLGAGAQPVSIAINANDDVFTANYSGGSISRIQSGSLVAEVVLAGLSTPVGVTTTSTGLLYFSSSVASRNSVSTAASVSSSISLTTASAGTSVTVEVNGLPAGVVMDDTTVTSVWWGDDTVPFTRTAGQNEVSVIVPSGTGSVPLVVEVNGGNAINAGTFSYQSAPPAPVIAPSAPLGVTGIAGDGSVSVSWSAPASSGSFPVSTYQVTSSPAGGSCLVSSTSCEVDGLTNGAAYSFTVRALNGAGWGPWSAASAEVTPRAPVQPSIVITGARGEVKGKPGVMIQGTSTGLSMGAVLRPWVRFPGQSVYSEGGASILVSADGTFDWQRKTGKRIYVIVKTADGSLLSNRVIIPAL